jgi:signal transduction histidine kinase
MNQQIVQQNPGGDYIADLVKTAMKQTELSGLSEILGFVARAVSAYGCILWMAAPGADWQSRPPSGRLFVLADWFEDGRHRAMYDLPIVGSANGKALVEQQLVQVHNLENSQEIYPSRFFTETGIKTLFALPIALGDDSGTICLYKKTRYPFSAEQVEKARRMADLISSLHQAIRDKVGNDLIYQINNVFHDAENQESVPTKQQIEDAFKRVCELVANAFHCMETSIFMEDKLEAPNEFSVVATTWPSGVFKKSVYKTSDKALTSWVLANNQSIRVFDLANFERDKEIIWKDYPKAEWSNSENLAETARAYFSRQPKINLRPEEDIPPLSFIAAPIFRTGRTLGVIRCAIAEKPPYLFAKRELSLLELVATQIRRFWSNCLVRRDLQLENEAWARLIEKLSELNSFVQRELDEKDFNEKKIFEEALRCTESIIEGADAMDIRLLDEEKKYLNVVAVQGEVWKKNPRALPRRYAVNENPPQSGGDYVYQNKTVYHVIDVEDPQFVYVRPTLFGTKRALLAPIQVGSNFFGVLNIRSLRDGKFPKYTESMAGLIGQQLGLYHFLADTIGKLHTNEEVRIQMVQDLAHQLKSPIIQAQAKIQEMLRETDKGNKRWAQLAEIRGICGRAKGVMINLKALAELEHTGSITAKRLKMQSLEFSSAVPLIKDIARDAASVVAHEYPIEFFVVPRGFRELYSNPVNVERDLFEQALSCVLDNAGKYSYPETRVEISAGVEQGRFYIAVINKGLALSSYEAVECIKRGWRSDFAELVTGEGMGIGLWLTDHIMKAHGGEVQVFPTTQEHITQVRLVFPIQKRK